MKKKPTRSTHQQRQNSQPKSLQWNLTLAALGVVFGDIGTSPLYAIKMSFHPSHGLPLLPENILGILSLVFWALVLVVSVKYLTFILRADNKGEGGITALLALLIPRMAHKAKLSERTLITMLGLIGAGLLYGDGVITPAITVLGAMEGLIEVSPHLHVLVVPLTVLILVFLFAFQSKGTQKLGSVFGPLILIWFIVIALMGIPWIIKRPDILLALSPVYAIQFMFRYGIHSVLVLSAVVLCITGGEALYADMGHFGKGPIRRGWYLVVFPALLLNYFGQGALVLDGGAAVLSNTFYGLVSGWMVYPVLVIATIAAIIASQALISGAFSLTQQTVQLGYFPRTTIIHTSRETEGQIYVPKINTFLAIACIYLVLTFQNSEKLADAYGIAVTGTMLITTLLFYQVMKGVWRWPTWKALSIVSIFLVFDISFFLANLTKFMHGGWIPIVIALAIFSLMTTWKQGREILSRKMSELAMPLEDFFEKLSREKPFRSPGTAVFMTLSRNIAPSVLLHYYKHSHTIPEKVILLSIITVSEPSVAMNERVRVTDLSHNFVKVVAAYGYVETPDIQEILAKCESCGLNIDLKDMSFYLGRETFVKTGNSHLSGWRKSLFIFLSRNARSATEYFRLPPDRVIEIGIQIEI